MSRADGSWLVDGSAAMEEVTTHFGIDSLPEDEAGAYHTIGGFVMARLGRVPKTADAFEWGGMRFEVIDMDGRRIDKVLVIKKPHRAFLAGIELFPIPTAEVVRPCRALSFPNGTALVKARSHSGQVATCGDPLSQ